MYLKLKEPVRVRVIDQGEFEGKPWKNLTLDNGRGKVLFTIGVKSDDKIFNEVKEGDVIDSEGVDVINYGKQTKFKLVNAVIVKQK